MESLLIFSEKLEKIFSAFTYICEMNKIVLNDKKC